MRLFIGTFLNAYFLKEAFEKFKLDGEKYFHGKWVESENLHFTFIFIGEVPDESVPALKDMLQPYLTQYEDKINISGLKCQPNLKTPNLLTCKINNPNKKIYEIRKEIAAKLTKANIRFDRRKFNPHLTLARIKSVSEGYDEFVKKNSDYKFGFLKGFSIKLIQSTLTHERPIYKVL